MTEQKRKGFAKRPIAVLAAVILVIGAMTVTVMGAETIISWFTGYFAQRSDMGLSEGQAEYIQENEQMISQGQTCGGWMVEVLSAMSDNSTGYIILGITGPEGMDITPYTFGNQGIRGHFEGMPDMLSLPEAYFRGSWGWSWIDDGDGLSNTRNLILHVNPQTKNNMELPLGEEQVFKLYLNNIVLEYEDEEYRRALMEGKYAGQDLPGFTPEETLRLYQHEIIAEGVWEYEVTLENLGGNGETVQLLTEPVWTKASFMQALPGGQIDDFEFVQRDVLLTGVVMDHLTVSFTLADGGGMPDLCLTEGDERMYPCVVMKDGSKVRLYPYGSTGSGTQKLLAEAPLVYAEVDYILMPSRTIIPMPEITE